MERYIGMDVHAASCTLAVISEKGRKLQDFPVETHGPRRPRQAPAGFYITPILGHRARTQPIFPMLAAGGGARSR